MVTKTICEKHYYQNCFVGVLFTDGTQMQAYDAVKAMENGELELANGKLHPYRYGHTIRTDAPRRNIKESELDPYKVEFKSTSACTVINTVGNPQ